MCDSLAEQLLEMQRQLETYKRKADSADERRLSEHDAALRVCDSLAEQLLEMQRQSETYKRKADSGEAGRQEAPSC